MNREDNNLTTSCAQISARALRVIPRARIRSRSRVPSPDGVCLNTETTKTVVERFAQVMDASAAMLSPPTALALGCRLWSCEAMLIRTMTMRDDEGETISLPAFDLINTLVAEGDRPDHCHEPCPRARLARLIQSTSRGIQPAYLTDSEEPAGAGTTNPPARSSRSSATRSNLYRRLFAVNRPTRNSSQCGVIAFQCA